MELFPEKSQSCKFTGGLKPRRKVTSPLPSAPQSFTIPVLKAEVWNSETLAALGSSLQAKFRGKLPPSTSLHPSFLQLIEIMTQLPGPGPL